MLVIKINIYQTGIVVFKKIMVKRTHIELTIHHLIARWRKSSDS